MCSSWFSLCAKGLGTTYFQSYTKPKLFLLSSYQIHELEMNSHWEHFSSLRLFKYIYGESWLLLQMYLKHITLLFIKWFKTSSCSKPFISFFFFSNIKIFRNIKIPVDSFVAPRSYKREGPNFTRPLFFCCSCVVAFTIGIKGKMDALIIVVT